MRTSHILRSFLLGATAVLGTATASAADFVTSSVSIDGSMGYRAGTIRYQSGTTNFAEGAYIGRIALTGSYVGETAKTTLYTWCVDIFDTLRNGTFKPGSLATLYSQPRVETLTRFVTNAIDLVKASDPDSAAAMQLGIWEILNEDAGNPYNVDYAAVGRGAFSVGKLAGYDLGGSVALANSWLGRLSGVGGAQPAWNAPAKGLALATIDPGQGNQPQMFLTSVPQVPEPATWLSMLTGFAGMGYALRRRRSRAIA